MSTLQNFVRFSQNSEKNGTKPRANSSQRTKRKSLQTLQPTSMGNGRLVGKNGLVNDQQKSKNGKKRKFESDKDDEKSCKSPRIHSIERWTAPVKIFQDPETKKSKEQKVEKEEDIDKEAYDLMVNETIPEKYWEEVAEQRRVALAEALEENEALHKQVTELKEENEKLSELASQTEYFANMVKFLTEDQADEDSSKISDEEHTASDKEHTASDKEHTDSDKEHTGSDKKHTDSDKEHIAGDEINSDKEHIISDDESEQVTDTEKQCDSDKYNEQGDISNSDSLENQSGVTSNDDHPSESESDIESIERHPSDS